MDLVTLITAYALNLEPKLMHALIRSNRVASHGRSQCRVGACLAPCQHFRPLSARRSRRALSAIASAWTDGVSMNRRSVTAVVFASCPNVRLAARQLTHLVERCNTTSKPDPSYCAIATGRGSSDRPDIGFADAVRATVKEDNAPNFDLPKDAYFDASDIASDVQSHKPDAALSTRAWKPDDRTRSCSCALLPSR